MYQKDYILRMIEMMGEFIAGILGLIKKGELQQATQELDNAYFNFLKQDAAFFRNLEKDKLTTVLIKDHNYTNGHLEILSELFYLEAELLYTEVKHKESLEFYEKALILFKFVEQGSKTYSIDKKARLPELQKRIEQLKIL
jgi:hypothetical protein